MARHILTIVAATILASGCAGVTEVRQYRDREASIVPLSGRYGYYFEGPHGITGTITKGSLDDPYWKLEGEAVALPGGAHLHGAQMTYLPTSPDQEVEVTIPVHLDALQDDPETTTTLFSTVNAPNNVQFRVSVREERGRRSHDHHQ